MRNCGDTTLFSTWRLYLIRRSMKNWVRCIGWNMEYMASCTARAWSNPWLLFGFCMPTPITSVTIWKHPLRRFFSKIGKSTDGIPACSSRRMQKMDCTYFRHSSFSSRMTHSVKKFWTIGLILDVVMEISWRNKYHIPGRAAINREFGTLWHRRIRIYLYLPPSTHLSTTATTKTRGVSRFVTIQTGLIDTNCAFGPEMNASYLQRGWCRHGKWWIRFAPSTNRSANHLVDTECRIVERYWDSM